MEIKRKSAMAFFAFIAAVTVGLVSYRVYLSQKPYSLENMDYLKINDTDSVIQLKSVKEMEFAFWKGSYEGKLFYKNGECVEVRISVYGYFFEIKENKPNLVPDGVLFEYAAE